MGDKSQPKCYVMVGLPGLGKSTLLNFVDNPEFCDTVFVYSTDRYIENAADRLGKTYDDVFEEYVGSATKYMNDALDSAIKDGVDVYWDQTNLGVKKRAKIINRMRQAGYAVHCICVIPPGAGWVDAQTEWKHRLANRPGKTIPDRVMKSMIDNYVEPEPEEGFDTVTYYNMYGVLITIDSETKDDS
jgi:predicted ABC-type ATPase